MNIDIKTIQKGLESIGICSLGNDEWQEIFINPQEAAEVRHFLADIRTMRQDYFEYILHKLVEMSTAGKSVQSKLLNNPPAHIAPFIEEVRKEMVKDVEINGDSLLDSIL